MRKAPAPASTTSVDIPTNLANGAAYACGMLVANTIWSLTVARWVDQWLENKTTEGQS